MRLRRARPGRLRRLPLLAAFCLGVLCLAALYLAATGCAFVRASRLLIYNGSPSAPRGFYLRSRALPRLGSFVTVRASAVAGAYAARRGFAGPRDYFIKRVAASSGAFVCAQAFVVAIDGTKLTRMAADSAGRSLPRWRGCRFLRANEYFLLGDTNESFDSRYWGPVSINEIEGVWTPLFSK